MRITPKRIRKLSKKIAKVAKEASIEHLEEVIAKGEGNVILHNYDGETFTAKALLEEVKNDTIAGRDYVKEAIALWAKENITK